MDEDDLKNLVNLDSARRDLDLKKKLAQKKHLNGKRHHSWFSMNKETIGQKIQFLLALFVGYMLLKSCGMN